MVDDKYTRSVAACYAGQRIDNFVFKYLKGVPKSRIYRAFRSGEVRLNGGRVKPATKLHAGDAVRIPPLRKAAEKERRLPDGLLQEVTESVIFKTDSLLLLNKPVGLAVHAGSGVEVGVAEAVAALYGSEWQLVHRLDRRVSGCLLFAKQGGPLRRCSAAFRGRNVMKQYLMIVDGAWQHGELCVNQPLRRSVLQGGERMVRVCADGKPSVTIFTPISVGDDISLLHARLVTGRTHQIRVHTAFTGHPIMGDDKYADKSTVKRWSRSVRQCLYLHSAVLGLPDQSLSFFVGAQLPQHWAPLLQKLSGAA